MEKLSKTSGKEADLTAMSLLKVEGLSKHFGGLKAVDGVSFSVYAGQIKALIGPNGAGKTTIFNLLTGIDKPDSGKIYLKEKEVGGLKPYKIAALGVGRTFQKSEIFNEMTVLENIMVGRHIKTSSNFIESLFLLPRALKDEKSVLEESMEIINFIGLEKKKNELGENLPHGERRLLEIARALAIEPEILLLDEPAAGLNPVETENLGKLIYKIREKGVTIFIVEHDMRLVVEISDEVIVLDYGKKIAEGPPRLIIEDEKVIKAYLGGDLEDA